MTPTIGRTVLYTLSGVNSEEIMRRRTTRTKISDAIKAGRWTEGAQAHIGNDVAEGTVVPMVIVRVWSGTCVNGQALLDGTDTLWVTSASEGVGPGTWAWPTRVE